MNAQANRTTIRTWSSRFAIVALVVVAAPDGTAAYELQLASWGGGLQAHVAIKSQGLAMRLGRKAARALDTGSAVQVLGGAR